MATYEAGAYVSLPAAGTLSAYTLVKVDTSGNAAATAVDTNHDVVGVLMEPAVAAQVVRILTLHGGAIQKSTTDNSAITVGVLLYKGASGKISATSTGSVAVGYALDANGSTDGAIIRFIPIQH